MSDGLLWVYCVVPADRGDIVEGELGAVVREVPEDEFGEEALERNLNELAWLERVARDHEAAIERVLAAGPVVPISLCTIYRSEEQVKEMLRERAGQFRDALERLAGTAEWGVKVIVDPAALEEHLSAGDDVDAASDGLAYIARKRQQARIRTEAEQAVASVVRDLHARLVELAVGSTLLPAQNRTLSGHQGEMVMNAAYLVPHERVEAFRAAVAEPLAPGFRVDLTGPWPAYNFAETG